MLTVLHRNPTLEEQALARIHRIGQKREVTTLRFYVRDSFEEVGPQTTKNVYKQSGLMFYLEQNVVKNQQFKKDLAGILLAPSGAAIDNMQHLEVGTITELQWNFT